jgi:type I restriction enzyme S subunit
VESGVPVIRGGNLTIDLTRFVDSGFVFITDDKANQLRNCEAFPGDLIFTAAGSLGQVGIVPHSAQHSRYIISNKQLRARVDERIVDPLFAFYWFSSPRMVAYIQQRNTGSTIPLINLSVLRTLPIPLPPIAEQHAIARILGTLDDKIDLNRRVNQTLEEMARAIFRSWFVEFDPVRARSEGRRPVGMSEATAALFPDRFEESQIGHIPVGWKIKPIGETVKLVGGGTPSTKEPNFWDGGTHCWLVGSSRDRTGPD